MSFSSGGKQYVSVLVGYGGSAAVTSDMLNVGWTFNAQPRRLLTVELVGKARLALSPPRDMTVHALDDPSTEIDEANITTTRDGYMMISSTSPGIRLTTHRPTRPNLHQT